MDVGSRCGVVALGVQDPDTSFNDVIHLLCSQEEARKKQTCVHNLTLTNGVATGDSKWETLDNHNARACARTQDLSLRLRLTQLSGKTPFDTVASTKL